VLGTGDTFFLTLLPQHGGRRSTERKAGAPGWNREMVLLLLLIAIEAALDERII